MARTTSASEPELALEKRTRLQLKKLKYLLIAIATVIILLAEAVDYFMLKTPLLRILTDTISSEVVALALIQLGFTIIFHLQAQLTQESNRLTGFHMISTAAIQSLNLNQRLQQSLDAIVHLEKFRGAMVILANEQDHSLVSTVTSGFSTDFIDRLAALQETARATNSEVDNLIEQAMLSKQPLIIQDIQTDPRFFPEYRQLMQENNIASSAFLPIISREKTLGSLWVSDEQVSRFSKEDVDWLTSVASQLGLAIENAKLYEQTKKEKEAKEHLARQVIRAQERERKIVATEVHDSLIQPLVAISNWTEALQKSKTDLNDAAKKRLDEFSNVVRGAISLGRSLITGLRPDLLELKGLSVAAQSFIEKTCVGKNIKVDFEADPLPKFGEEIEVAAFRVIQEAVRNTLWHAQATKLQVKLTLDPSKNLVVTVKDNGRGFNTQEALSVKMKSEHIGLATIIERAALVGGHTEIKSSPGQGAEILATFPPPKKEIS